MNLREVMAFLLVILAVALVGGLIFAISLIGAGTLQILAFVLIVGLALAGVLAAAALPIRAWRKSDSKPIEKQVIVRETRILDNRPAPMPQLPPPAQPAFGVFPELLRASYQAGALSHRPAEVVDAEVRELPEDGWNGSIT